MKSYIPFLTASLAVTTSTLLFTTSVMGESNQETSCPSVQLDQLHAHWNALVVEKNPETRTRLILEHRKLVAQAKQTEAAAAKGEVPDDCTPKVGWHHHDLGNMVEMHSMMLDMIVR